MTRVLSAYCGLLLAAGALVPASADEINNILAKSETVALASLEPDSAAAPRIRTENAAASNQPQPVRRAPTKNANAKVNVNSRLQIVRLPEARVQRLSSLYRGVGW